nr:MAG TPA: SNAP25/syntaxin 1a-coil, polar layer, ENDOCYTOSIS-EXOCYTOSIS COMPLEX.0A [Caudoviricetes sp.]
MDYVLFICSIVACLVGVLTFVVGMNGRAKNDGVVVQKINQAIEGIEELKSDVKNLSSSQQSLALLVNSHEEQIKTLFNMMHSSEANTQALITITETLKHIEGRDADEGTRYSH